jgi:hypothetical protein
MPGLVQTTELAPAKVVEALVDGRTDIRFAAPLDELHRHVAPVE